MDDMKEETGTDEGLDTNAANIVSPEDHAITTDNDEDAPTGPGISKAEKIRYEPECDRISQEQLTAEAMSTYASLAKLESECVKVHQILTPRLDVTAFLEVIPSPVLARLHQGNIDPEITVQDTLINATKKTEATRARDQEPSSRDSTEEDWSLIPDKGSCAGPASEAPSEDTSTAREAAVPTVTANEAAKPPETKAEEVPVETNETPARPASTGADQPYTDDATAPEPQVPATIDIHVPHLGGFLNGFLVAQELRAKTAGWPEYEALAALTTEAIGEEGRKKVLDDGENALAVGYELADALQEMLEEAERNIADKEAAEETAREAQEKAEDETKAKATEEEAPQENDAEVNAAETHTYQEDVKSTPTTAWQSAAKVVTRKNANPVPEATLESVGETPPVEHSPSKLSENKAPITQEPAHQTNPTEPSQARPSDATPEPTPEEPVTQKRSVHLANPFAEESPTSPQEASVKSQVAVETIEESTPQAEGTVVETEDTKDTKPNNEPTPLTIVDVRSLDNKELYKKIGDQYFMLAGDRWIKSMDAGGYQALWALHHNLLNEHVDFFSKALHPHSSPELRCLPKKYSMAARMRSHGIYSYLEVLRCRLPESLEHMITFILDAYRTVALLEEYFTVDQPVWIEVNADLARYRYLKMLPLLPRE